MRVNKKSLTVLSSVVATLIIVVASMLAYHNRGPERKHQMASSWAFDLANPELVAGYADSVVIGRVVGNEGFSKRQPPSTTFRVQVIATVKGSAENSILIDQYGGRSGRDVWVLEDQTPLKVGALYALALTGSDNAPRTLISGPASVTEIEESQVSNQLNVWKAHVAKNQHPDMPS